ncbi:MAG: efflux RND transporter permease subunit [Acidiferrobacter sp.]
MINRVIDWSLQHRLWVLGTGIAIVLWGAWSFAHMPVDALPDLSNVQVIVKASYHGRSPEVVEKQVTYPLTTALLAVPGAHAVRAYSMFGESLTYVVFDSGTNLYAARNLVQQYLGQVSRDLPRGVSPTLGIPATGLGWIYEYALVDHGGPSLGRLTSLQNWFLRYQLEQLPGVAGVATIGGLNRDYNVDVNPSALWANHMTLAEVAQALSDANGQVGGGVIDTRGGSSYFVQTGRRGYIHSLAALRGTPLRVGPSGTPLTVGDIARVHRGPGLRYGVADLNGKGPVVGAVVMARTGSDTLAVIHEVRTRLKALAASLPAGVHIVTTYNRARLIQRTLATLRAKLLEESLIVALVCLLFLSRLRSALVAIAILPVGILAAFGIMQAQGLNANIMSLSGIAIAIGAMVDGAIVMIENMHKHRETRPDLDIWASTRAATREVGPALFFSLLIISVSFTPIFALHGEQGRLFRPLAFTKTYAMGIASLLSITLVPVLMGYLIRGPIPREDRNLINRFLHKAFTPLSRVAMNHGALTTLLAVMLIASTFYPLSRIGHEFMPPLYEGDLMYMPIITLPSVSIGEASALLQRTDRLIMQFPEVREVFGKAGRADTSTDPAPLSMFETVIRLKPRAQWPVGMDVRRLRRKLNNALLTPALANDWTMPIAARVDMLSTGVRTPIGIKVFGPKLSEIQRLAVEIQDVLTPLRGTSSAFANRIDDGHYLAVRINRAAAAHYGLTIASINSVVRTAVAGQAVATTLRGYARYPIVLRYPRKARQSVRAIRRLLIVTPGGAAIPLAAVAAIVRRHGPTEIDTEGGQMYDVVTVATRGVSLGSYVAMAKKAVANQVRLPPGYTLRWSGEYRFYRKTVAQLGHIVPIVVVVIFGLLALAFGGLTEAIIILLTLPFGLVGGIWLVFLLGYKMSLAVAVGFIAAAGIAAEFGVILLLYINQAILEQERSQPITRYKDLQAAVLQGTTKRLRPINMTATVIILGLLPIFVSDAAGADVMKRIAAPLLGAMITAPALSLLVIPVIYVRWRGRHMSRSGPAGQSS